MVLSIVPLIRPFQWQSLFLPVISVTSIVAALSEILVGRYLSGCSSNLHITNKLLYIVSLNILKYAIKQKDMKL